MADQVCDPGLLLHYGPGLLGRQPLPAETLMYNKLVMVRKHFASRFGAAWVEGEELRNIKIGLPAKANRLHVGEVARHGAWTYVRNFES